MKKIILSAIAILSFGICSNTVQAGPSTQQPTYRTVSGYGSTSGDSFAAAMRNMPDGSMPYRVSYSSTMTKTSQLNGYNYTSGRFICIITYKVN